MRLFKPRRALVRARLLAIGAGLLATSAASFFARRIIMNRRQQQH